MQLSPSLKKQLSIRSIYDADTNLDEAYFKILKK